MEYISCVLFGAEGVLVLYSTIIPPLSYFLYMNGAEGGSSLETLLRYSNYEHTRESVEALNIL